MARFIYDIDNSDPKNGLYGIYDAEDQQTNYYTKEDIIKFQTDPFYVKRMGLVIDGLPKELQVVKKTENLQKAKKAKNDEFYTQLSDIEKELMNYDPTIFKDKVIYCPTDVAYAQGRILPSEFVHYFQMNARRLGFKKLIATCLAEKVDNQGKVYNKYILERKINPNYSELQKNYYSEDLPDEINYVDPENGDYIRASDAFHLGVFNVDSLPNNDGLREYILRNAREYSAERSRLEAPSREKYPFNKDMWDTFNSKYVIEVTLSECGPDEDGKYGSGDFRSKECTEILKKSDIVVTNPPFSLFREFVVWLKQGGGTLKPCILVGSQNAITYKEVFPLIRDNKFATGYTGFTPDMYYAFPDDLRCGINEKDIETANKKGFKGNVTRLGNTCWFTTEKYKKALDSMLLVENYYEEDGTTPLPDAELRYPKYDNYDVINIDRVNQIPRDYYGVMGVPITFVDKYNPDQFKIVGMAEDNGKGYSGIESNWDGLNPHCVVNGKNMYKRIFILRIDAQKREKTI